MDDPMFPTKSTLFTISNQHNSQKTCFAWIGSRIDRFSNINGDRFIISVRIQRHIVWSPPKTPTKLKICGWWYLSGHQWEVQGTSKFTKNVVFNSHKLYLTSETWNPDQIHRSELIFHTICFIIPATNCKLSISNQHITRKNVFCLNRVQNWPFFNMWTEIDS